MNASLNNSLSGSLAASLAMAKRYTLGSDSRLKREQHIETLFRTGKAFSVFPIRVIWLLQPLSEETSAVKAGFSVPKKKFKLAVDRARIKRLLRESWRLQQHEVIVPDGRQLHFFLLFTDTSLPYYEPLFAAVGKAIAKLKTLLEHE